MIAFLRSVWNAHSASPAPPRRVWRDWVLVAALVPIAVLEGFLRPDLPGIALTTVATAALVPTLLWRRIRPLAMLTIAFVTMWVVSLIIGGSPQTYTQVFFLLLFYSVFRWGSGRAAVGAVGLMAISIGSSVLLGSLAAEDILGSQVVVFATAAIGLGFRFRASTRSRELETAKLLERERLARDLHDTVAHHVSAIAVRAQAGLATASTNPDAATDALELIATEASRTLAEMRTMVHVLRTDATADLTPGAQVTDLEQLAGSDPDGPEVRVKLSGDVENLPPAVGAAIFRVAQESVTNARRHSRHATRIDVQVDADKSQVRLSVRDDGDAGPAGAPGFGITGMIERVTLLGGTITAGRAKGRGWTVDAVLPRTGWST